MTSAHEDIRELIAAYEAAEAEYLAEPCALVGWSGDDLVAIQVRPFPAALRSAWQAVSEALSGTIKTNGLTPVSRDLQFFASRSSTPLSLHVSAIGPAEDGWHSLDRYDPVVEGSILGHSAAKVTPPQFFFRMGVVYDDRVGSHEAPGVLAREALQQISA